MWEEIGVLIGLAEVDVSRWWKRGGGGYEKRIRKGV